MELHFGFGLCAPRISGRDRGVSRGIIRRDQLLVGWAPGGPVSAARLISAVAPLPWLLFTYYRSAVVRRYRQKKEKQGRAVCRPIALRAEGFRAIRRPWRSKQAMRAVVTLVVSIWRMGTA